MMNPTTAAKALELLQDLQEHTFDHYITTEHFSLSISRIDGAIVWEVTDVFYERLSEDDLKHLSGRHTCPLQAVLQAVNAYNARHKGRTGFTPLEPDVSEFDLEPPFDLYVCESSQAVELRTHPTVANYAEWIDGEGADICLYREQETKKVVGCRLPLRVKKGKEGE
jgi:hypothetical protein